MDLRRKVTEFIEKHRLVSPCDCVLVAVSGGPDSVALLHLLYDLCDELEVRLEVAHLQHGIRGSEAQEDARFVAELAAKLGLPFHLKEVNLHQIKSAAGKGNLEALARAERYRFFAAVARERNLNRIATAHTRDDQAETVLMWLLRGSGLKGLGGMLPTHQLNGTNIESASRLIVIRPLLDVSRAEIEDYLNEKHLTFRLDRSNQDPSFLRNWIRLKLIPQLKDKMDRNLPSRLAQQAELIREEEQFLEELTHAELDRIRTPEGIDRGALLKYNKALQRRLLRLWIESMRGHLRGLISTGTPRAAVLPASSDERIASATEESKSHGSASSATRAPRSSGPYGNDGNTSGPAVTSVRAAPVTRNATSPVPPGDR